MLDAIVLSVAQSRMDVGWHMYKSALGVVVLMLKIFFEPFDRPRPWLVR